MFVFPIFPLKVSEPGKVIDLNWCIRQNFIDFQSFDYVGSA